MFILITLGLCTLEYILIKVIHFLKEKKYVPDFEVKFDDNKHVYQDDKNMDLKFSGVEDEM